MKKLLTLIILCSLLLSGCNNHSMYADAMTAGNNALSNSQYDVAVEQFQIALSEKKDDCDAITLKEQTEKYVSALDYYNHSQYDQCLKQLNSVINMINGSQELIDHAQNMKSEVEKDKELDNNIKQYTASAQNYFISGNYEKAIKDVNQALKYIDDNEDYITQKNALLSLKDNCNHALIKISKNNQAKKQEEETKSEDKDTLSKNTSEETDTKNITQ